MTATCYDSYELGYAAETGIKAITGNPDALPSFDYVEALLLARLEQICHEVGATEDFSLYITEGETFRYALAKTAPYKGTRISKKPWHFNNLTVYMKDVLGAKVVTYLEADDQLAIDHTTDPEGTVVVSRDKDLRQVPGWFYSWELGNQAAYGPAFITKEGHLRLSEKKKLKGTGLPFFYSQCLTGDTVDNIPGIPGLGPVKVFALLEDCDTPQDYLDAVIEAYQDHHGHDWEEHLLEQGRLLWMTRRLNPDGTPVLWEIGMED